MRFGKVKSSNLHSYPIILDENYHIEVRTCSKYLFNEGLRLFNALPVFIKESINAKNVKNSRNAAELYAQRYLNRQHPMHQYFRQDGNRNAEETFMMNEDTEINVIAMVEVDKTVSLRKIAQELQISHESARKILKKHGYQAFIRFYQHLYADDGDRRWCFVIGCFKIIEVTQILLTLFYFLTNPDLRIMWAQQTQHEMREGNFQESFGVNVWGGVVGNRIIGPILFQGHLTGARYLGFLKNEIEEHLNGAPPHNTREVLNYLIEHFNNKVIATNNGPALWPARSPDLIVRFLYLGIC
ncbi:hypothetical protein NQ315_015400 [Exocentrus adspersus]|uniref:Uncharacterized protein n=1 Tax=Exocentrus adspersus TaxID=1586481 RepID=A0AAV8V9G4_9CUCU|nr:hypothetical protein NQ315_015400 [Exocentrus adspersus]